MKFTNKNLLVLLAAGFSLSVVSCDKEETVKDMEVPTVNLEVSGNPNKLFNEVTLSATATDNNTVSQIIFYLNDDSVASTTQMPFEIKWNTKEVEDGKYILKAVAVDAYNNKGEASQEIIIKNTLFQAKIEEGYLAGRNSEHQQHDRWLYLSDKNGNTIGEPKQIANNTTLLKWERPQDFYSDTIYFNEVTYNNHGYPGSARVSKYLSLTSHADFTLDEIFIKSNPSSKMEPVGKIGITINNDTDGSIPYTYSTDFSRTGHRWQGYSGTSIFYEVNMYQNQEKGLTTYEYYNPDDYKREKYYKWNEYVAGNNYTFHFNDFESMNSKKVKLPEGYTSLFIDISGISSDRSTSVSLDFFSVWDHTNAPTEIDMFYADKLFTHHSTYIYYIQDNKTIYQNFTGKAPETIVPPNLTLEVSSNSMKNISLSRKGNIDIGGISWGYVEDSEAEYLDVSQLLYVSGEPATYKFPEIPSQILKLYPALANESKFKHKHTYLLDNFGASSYKEILNFWFSNESFGPEYSEFNSTYKYPETAESRMLRKRPDLQAEMKKEKLRVRGLPGFY